VSAGARPVPAGFELIDLRHLGRERVIGAWLVGDVLVDPGPSTCIPALLSALGDRRPRALALTHIHLDHAGASGSLLAHLPEAEVWVHERGAPHLRDPSKLLASATRLYGADMERLWGEVLPVPAERLRVLSGGERIGGFAVDYAPGHASHHVCYLHEDSGYAFAGDVAGVRIASGPVLPPTPPPDIDLDAWRRSLDTLEARAPSAVVTTHFGVHEDVARHLAAIREELAHAEQLARDHDEAGFADAVRARLAAATDPATAAVYEQALPPSQSYQGLARYLARGGAEGRK
jgi:glyoxylase-like metal-dependent hydrolase (beta-lactamase superfamily II)